MSQTLQQPEITDSGTSGRWMTLIFDNDETPLELVILTLMVSTKCDVQEAEMEAWEAQAYGKAPVHFSTEADCTAVAQAMENIGVKSAVQPEWDD
ncbi:MAG: ATP-dependent Clp protease adaptor ClpS [Armatimonadetes bacterium]|nr:ATP-dependent Clp protease adaptor ClpS [Armatimonadota bacterium]MBS1728976.1 ATP-dependent Clp protease adaptor ClpS [Armatimonadota bacterium]